VTESILQQLEDATLAAKGCPCPDVIECRSCFDYLVSLARHAKALIDVAKASQEIFSSDEVHGEDCPSDPFNAEYLDDELGECECGARKIRAALAKLEAKDDRK